MINLMIFVIMDVVFCRVLLNFHNDVTVSVTFPRRRSHGLRCSQKHPSNPLRLFHLIYLFLRIVLLLLTFAKTVLSLLFIIFIVVFSLLFLLCFLLTFVCVVFYFSSFIIFIWLLFTAPPSCVPVLYERFLPCFFPFSQTSGVLLSVHHHLISFLLLYLPGLFWLTTFSSYHWCCCCSNLLKLFFYFRRHCYFEWSYFFVLIINFIHAFVSISIVIFNI